MINFVYLVIEQRFLGPTAVSIVATPPKICHIPFLWIWDRQVVKWWSVGWSLVTGSYLL